MKISATKDRLVIVSHLFINGIFVVDRTDGVLEKGGLDKVDKQNHLSFFLQENDQKFFLRIFHNKTPKQERVLTIKTQNEHTKITTHQAIPDSHTPRVAQFTLSAEQVVEICNFTKPLVLDMKRI